MIEHGIHLNISPRDYHAWEFDPDNPSAGPVSNSLFKRFVKVGPLAFKYGPKRQGSAAMSWGSLVDCLLFTPNQFDAEFSFKEDNPHLSADGGVRSKAAREWQAEREEAGTIFIKGEDHVNAQLAVERLRETPIAAEIIEGADFQVALSYTADHGVPFKALLDTVPHHLDHDDSIVDLKTTGANLYSDDDLARQVGKFGYHIQAALYLYAWNKLSSDYRNRWQIVWQSSAPPYEVRVTELDQGWIEAGRSYVRYHMPRFLRSLKANVFRSPFRDVATFLPLHSNTLYGDENEMELLSNLAA